MGSLSRFCLAYVVLTLVAFVQEKSGKVLITGRVYCDECKDGRVDSSDYPLEGMEVLVVCSLINGKQVQVLGHTTSSGSYSFDLNGSVLGCEASLWGNGMNWLTCGVIDAAPPQPANLVLQLHNTAIYLADPLLSQPTQPRGFCQKTSPPLELALQPPPTTKPVVNSACPYDFWSRPENRCNWKVVKPKTKIAEAFGRNAAGMYGTEMTLWEGLVQEKGNIFTLLLHEGITALLNSYNDNQFAKPTNSILDDMNFALTGAPRQALLTALEFRRANSGNQSVHTPCGVN